MREYISVGSTMGRPRSARHAWSVNIQQLVRLDYEDRFVPSAEIDARLWESFEAHVELCDMVVVSDYAKE
jgi:bifunctional ADP-heptose synthase (sugar kinase/adenylyltransferase)